jgi:outer membrane protein
MTIKRNETNMSKNLTTLAVVLACTLLTPMVAAAQAAPGPKIGVVSFRALLQGSPQARDKIKAIQDEFAQRERQLEAKQKELKDRQAKLQKDAQVMGAEERRAAEAKFRDDERDLGRRINEFQEDLNVRRNEVLGGLQEDLVKEVRSFAAQGGYDIVLSEQGDVIYAGNAMDLTGKVLASIEARAKAPPKPAAKP